MAVELRQFAITVTRHKSSTDTTQTPATATVTLHPEGASVKTGVTVATSTTVEVYDVGDIVAGDTLQVGTDTGRLMTVNSITDQDTLVATLVSGSGALVADDRLVLSALTVSTFKDDRGTTADVNPITTNANTGFAKTYILNKNVDAIITGTGITTRLITDLAAGASRNVVHLSEEAVLFDGTDGSAVANSAAMDAIVTKVARAGHPMSTLWVPRGLAHLDNQQQIDGTGTAAVNDIELRGEAGGGFKAKALFADDYLFFIGSTAAHAAPASDTLRIRGVEFDGAGETDKRAWGVRRDITKVWFQNCIFRNWPTTSTGFGTIFLGEDSSTRANATPHEVIIENCIFDTAGNSIFIRRAKRVSIHGCLFRSCRTGVVLHAGTAGDTIEQISIEGNQFYELTREAVRIESDNPAAGTRQTFDITVRGNTIVAETGTSNTEAIYLIGVHEAIVQGNTIRNMDVNGIKVDGARGVILAENTIRNCGGQGILMQRDGTFLPQENVIRGNIVSECTGSGIWVQDGQRNLVSGNHCRDNNEAGTATGAGIRLVLDGTSAQDADGNVLDSNYCYNNDDGALGNGIHIITTTNGQDVTNTLVHGNYLKANVTNLNDNGVATVLANNVEIA